MASNLNKLIGKKIADRYCITGEIGKGGMGYVYRAIPFDDPSRDVAIKVIVRDRALTYEDSLRFQKEAALMSRLYHPNIISFYELGLLDNRQDDGTLGEIDNGYYIVMEYAEGVNLKESLAKESRKDLAFFFEVGIKVAAALDYTHGKNIIHRDIKPQNIIIARSRSYDHRLIVKVLDFGVARLNDFLYDQAHSGVAIQEIAGTPLYMAPEQTSLMDAQIDHRVDLYSLGCVLYEILTGRPPFVGSSRELLERYHVYDEVEPITRLRPDVPPIVEKIVHRLLAKRPEDRYQTAFAVYADLLRAKNLLRQAKRKSQVSFPLALKDNFKAVSSQITFMGREQEFDQLVAFYNKLSRERSRSLMYVVKGEAGIGKSRLLNEFSKYLAQRNVRQIVASFSQHENALPFNALANGFNDYLIRLYKSHSPESEELKRRIKRLLGPSAYLVAEVVPGLKPFLAPTNSENALVEEMIDKTPSFQRFAKAFSDFTRCLAADNEPVVFVFDDLHWADEKSIDLIDQFISYNNSQRYLMVVGYRSDEPRIPQRFFEFINRFRKLKRRYQELELKRFEPEAIKNLVHDVLNSHTIANEEAESYIIKSSAGIPMRIVEITRALVLQDLIYYDHAQQQWLFNHEAIKQGRVRYNSIDLALTRLNELDKEHSRILQVAAVVGFVFQEELIFVDESFDRKLVEHVLKRAVQDGILVYMPEDPHLANLGQQYQFAHWRARELLYQIIDDQERLRLHYLIAQKMYALNNNQNDRMLFAMVHHMNAYLGQQKARKASIARQYVTLNVKAAHRAIEAGSLQSAQRYFENAWNQINLWPNEPVLLKDREIILEKLADIIAQQKRHDEAIVLYEQLWKQASYDAIKARVVYKMLLLNLARGSISKTHQRLIKYLNYFKLGRKQFSTMRQFGFKMTYYSRVGLAFCLGRDWLTVKVLKQVKQHLSRSSTIFRDRDPHKNLFHIASWLARFEHKDKLANFHEQLLRGAYQGAFNPVHQLRVMGIWAADLSYFGAYKAAYKIFDGIHQLTQSSKADKEARGMAHLLRAITIEYLKDKDEAVDYHFERAFDQLDSTIEDVMWKNVAIEFYVFRHWQSGKLDHIPSLIRLAKESIRTRNPYSPRAFSIIFFMLFLRDMRDVVAQVGEAYLKRRIEKKSRQEDVFVDLIKTLVAYSRGDFDRSRKALVSAIKGFYRDHGVLWAFEVDFVGVFILIFLDVFQYEQKKKAYRSTVMREIFKLLIQVMSSRYFFSHRCLYQLIMARCWDQLCGYDEKGKKIKSFYDAAIQKAKLGNHRLILTVAQLWFGHYLVRHGATSRASYLEKSWEVAERLKTPVLMNLIVQYQLNLGILSRQRSVLKSHAVQRKSDLSPYCSHMVLNHSEHLAEIMSQDMAFEANFEESLGLLSHFIEFENAHLIFANIEDQDYELVYPFERTSVSDDVMRYVAPYISIRTTLFLPINDAPWIQDHHEEKQALPTGAVDQSVEGNSQWSSSEVTKALSQTPQHVSDSVKQTLLQGVSHSQGLHQKQIALDSTQVDNKGMSHQQTWRQAADPSFSESQEGAVVNELRLSALIPIRVREKEFGVLYLENIDMQGKDSVALRSSFDMVGAQLGILVAHKRDATKLTHQYPLYQSGQMTLEEVSWLQLAQHGRLRAKRDSVWYLGLNLGDDYYWLVYCRVNGVVQEREKFSAALWYYIQSLRIVLTSGGRHEYDVKEIRQALTSFIKQHYAVSDFDDFSLAFTLFKRREKVALSGHFGRSRPIVVGQENLVTPENRVVARLKNDKDLRYWSVEASLAGPHAYILAHDTSKLELVIREDQKMAILRSLQQTGTPKEFHELLQQVLVKDIIPRYYVGAVLNTTVVQEDGSENSESSASKPGAA